MYIAEYIETKDGVEDRGKMKKRIFLHKILLGISIVLVIGVLVIVGWYYISLKDFYTENSGSYGKKEFEIPGLEDQNFVEQGLCYDKEKDYFYLTGYMSDKRPDPIHIVEGESGKWLKSVYLLHQDGSPMISHAGGLATAGKYIYLAGSGDCCLYVYSKQEILDAPDGEGVKSVGTFSTAKNKEDGVKVSWVAGSEKMIYVGEFYLEGSEAYRLRENHKIETATGNNSAIMIGFQIDENAEFGLAPIPVEAYSLPDKVQGVAFGEEAIYLSQSYAIVPSHISKNRKFEMGQFTIMNATVPLYSLMEIASYTVIPMSEEIDIRNGKLYIATEAAMKFPLKIGTVFDAEWIHSMDVIKKDSESTELCR